MNTLRLHIQPVYSEEHLDPKYLIGSVRLLRHQVETWEAYQDPNIDIVFNTAMTGDGKSLAAYLPAFQDGKSVIAMYPTNELILDQLHALPTYKDRLKIDLPSHAPMYGDEITRLMRIQDQAIRVEAVRGLLLKGGILLTNPDLIHLMM